MWKRKGRGSSPVVGVVVAVVGLGLGIGMWRAPISCGVSPAPGGNVVLFTIDTLRARNLGAYGYRRDTSPHIDRLAADGALFQGAFAPSPWTIPSLATLLTSLRPSRHGAVNANTGLGDEVPLVAEILHDAGYATAMFVQAAYPLTRMGFDQGFDVAESGTLSTLLPRVRRWVHAHRHHPFFLWVHFAEPHIPYFSSPEADGVFLEERLDAFRDVAGWWSPTECKRRYELDADRMRHLRVGFYDQTIRDSDRRLGQLVGEIDRLGLTDETAVIVTADHGEEFFEHQGCDHGWTFYDELVHVPLIVKRPGLVPPGREVGGQVRLLDVAPTILELAGVPVPAGFEGTSLLAFARGAEPNLPVFGEYLKTGERGVYLRRDGFKYIASPRRSALVYAHRKGERFEEFYDLRADPEERHDLAPGGHPRLAEFRAAVDAWLAAQGSGHAARHVELGPGTVDKLKALGYLHDDPNE